MIQGELEDDCGIIIGIYFVKIPGAVEFDDDVYSVSAPFSDHARSGRSVL